jgi:hypothetical protein
MIGCVNTDKLKLQQAMKQIVIYFGLIITLSASEIAVSYSQEAKFVPMISTIIAPDKGKEMLRQPSRPTPGKIQKFFTLTPGAIDTLLLNFTKIQTVKTGSGKKITKSLGTYGYQYIGVVIKNKKYIYINAFDVKCPQNLFTKYKDWETEPVKISKGGKSFWGVLFDLEDWKFCELEINETA